MPFLECRDLEVEYPTFTLGPLSFTLRPGERVALVGPNGAGKTTTVRALAGRVGDHGGAVLVDGRPLTGLLPAARQGIGYLPESLLGFGWMTVAEHFRFLARFYLGWDEAYADHLIEHLELDRNTRLGVLSKGSRVKVSFIAAEAYRPSLLILDEPTSGIDPVMRRELLDAIRQALHDPERLLLFSTHLLEDIEKIADRVIVLRRGRVREDVELVALSRRWPDRTISESIEAILTDTDPDNESVPRPA